MPARRGIYPVMRLTSRTPGSNNSRKRNKDRSTMDSKDSVIREQGSTERAGLFADRIFTLLLASQLDPRGFGVLTITKSRTISCFFTRIFDETK